MTGFGRGRLVPKDLAVVARAVSEPAWRSSLGHRPAVRIRRTPRLVSGLCRTSWERSSNSGSPSGSEEPLGGLPAGGATPKSRSPRRRELASALPESLCAGTIRRRAPKGRSLDRPTRRSLRGPADESLRRPEVRRPPGCRVLTTEPHGTRSRTSGTPSAPKGFQANLSSASRPRGPIGEPPCRPGPPKRTGAVVSAPPGPGRSSPPDLCEETNTRRWSRRRSGTTPNSLRARARSEVWSPRTRRDTGQSDDQTNSPSGNPSRGNTQELRRARAGYRGDFVALRALCRACGPPQAPKSRMAGRSPGLGTLE